MVHTSRTNFLKYRALEIFARYGALNPPAWASLANIWPVRSAYTYLLRLYRYGLLNREHDHSGFLVYTISTRGRERLDWLQCLQRPQSSQNSPMEATYGASIPSAVK